MIFPRNSRLPVPPPALLLRPMKLIPQPLLENLVALVAGRVLADALDDGSLDILKGRILAITVSGPALRLRLTLAGGRLRSAGAGPADVTISARADDLVLLAARRIDPDTLFFQRRLRLSGDTELGLAVKNVLDTVALETLPPALGSLLEHLADAVDPGAVGK